MEEFIYDLPEGKNKDILDRAIRGSGAFRRFKDRIYDFGLENSGTNIVMMLMKELQENGVSVTR